MASFSIPSFVKGALWGVIVWAVAIVGAFSFGPVMRSYLGNDGRFNVREAIGVLCTWVAFPIHTAVCCTISPENCPEWSKDLALNIALGPLVLVTIGALAGHLLTRRLRCPQE